MIETKCGSLDGMRILWGRERPRDRQLWAHLKPPLVRQLREDCGNQRSALLHWNSKALLLKEAPFSLPLQLALGRKNQNENIHNG